MKNLDHKQFSKDVGGPIDRKREFKNIQHIVHRITRDVENGSMNWDGWTQEQIFNILEITVKFMEHITDGLLDIRKETQYFDDDGRRRYVGNSPETIKRMRGISQLVDDIIPREFRKY